METWGSNCCPITSKGLFCAVVQEITSAQGWKPGDPIYPFGAPAQLNTTNPASTATTSSMFDLDLNPDLTAQVFPKFVQ